MTQIYAYGSNGNGQLGVGHQLDVSTPKNVLIDIADDVQPIAIRAGGNHTLILTSDGQLYSSGDPSKGARGLTPAEGFGHNKFTPVVLSAPGELPLQVTLCAATWEASIIVAKDAEGRSTKLYTFGTGEKGELGQGHLIFRSAKAGLISNFPPGGVEIVRLSACMNHVVVVLDNGEVYGWGNGRKGQLGNPTGIIYAPRKIAHDLIYPSVTCGKDFTLLSVPATGDYKLLGSDRHDIKKALPLPQSSLWNDVQAGWGSVTVLKEDGKLNSAGRNDHGQLAPANLPKISRIAVGSEHTIALSEEADAWEVLAWGWGEHGNCGPFKGNGPNIIASSKNMPDDIKLNVSLIACGCATSFICVQGGVDLA